MRKSAVRSAIFWGEFFAASRRGEPDRGGRVDWGAHGSMSLAPLAGGWADEIASPEVSPRGPNLAG